MQHTKGQINASSINSNLRKMSRNFEFKISFKIKQKTSQLLKISNSTEMANFARACFDADQIDWVESFIVIALNRAMKVLGFYKVSSGGVSSTIADPKIIYQFALLSNASYIVIAHNHPSGSLKPSDQDIQQTIRIKAAGGILEIKLLDHIIVSDSGSYSFADDGII